MREQEQLEKALLAAAHTDHSPDEQGKARVAEVLRRAQRQTGVRDMLVLAFVQVWKVWLALLAPLFASSKTKTRGDK